MGYITNADRMLIGGKLVASSSGEWDECLNPALRKLLAACLPGLKRMSRADAAAQKAWPEWARTPIKDRAEILRQFGRNLLARRDDIPARRSRRHRQHDQTDARRREHAVDSPDYYSGIAHELKGETIPATSDHLYLTIREPYGVVARIVPFNHPLMFAVARTAAALASGNAVVVKPPETSPLPMLLAEVAAASLPPGLFNVVTGHGRTVGDAIVSHPDSSALRSSGRSRPAGRSSAPPRRIGQTRLAGTRRQEPDDRVPRQRSRRDRPRGDIRYEFYLAGTILRLDQPTANPPGSARSRARSLDRARREAARRRPDERRERDGASQFGRSASKRFSPISRAARQEGARLTTGGAAPTGEMFRRGYRVDRPCSPT